MKKIFILVLISFLSFINFFQALETSAQVVIEEKVEINPQKFVNRDNPAFFFPDSIYDNPGNHIISNPNIQFDGPGSTITLPRAGRLQVTVYSFNAAEPSKFDLFLEQPSQLTILENANHNIGYAWCSEDYPANTNVEFGIHWLWNYYGMIYQGSEAGAQTTQLNANLYQIGFEAAGDDWDYNDLVILVEIIEMPSFDVTVYPEEITSGEEASFEIYLADCPPREIEVNLEIIEGQEYGSLVNPLTNEKTKIITNLELPVGLSWIYFLPEGVSVEETKIVIVRVGINEPSSQPKEDTIYIKPPPVYVYTIPDIVGANDTADVIIKHRLEDGTLEDFPPEQTFELAVLEGCVNGNFLVGEEINVYFADAQQPIKFVTADNLDEEFGKVLIRVGTFFGMIGRPVIGGNEEEITDKAENMNVTSTRRAAFEKMISQKSTEMEKQKADFNKTDGEGTEPNTPGDVPIITACATDNSYYSPYWEGFANVGDECDEEIVVCNNYQPPKFEDVSTITELGENDPWQWIDNQGNPQTINTGTACDYEIDPKEFGKTYILPKIGDFSTGNPPPPVYNRLDDMKVIACADKSNPIVSIWRISVNNLRVPIFTDHCPAPPAARGFIDLEDGSNTTLLIDNIKNCVDYNNVMTTLDWWLIGPSRQGGEPPHTIYFSAGSIAHENIHVVQLRDGGTTVFPVASILKEMNGPDGLVKLAEYDDYIMTVYKCPEDVLNSLTGKGSTVKLKDHIKKKLSNVLSDANNLERRGGYKVVKGSFIPNSELEADELARGEYDKIKKRINNWAKQQSWWCELRIIGLYDPPRFYNCKFVPCNP